jgi:hypothetical protein
MVEKVHAAQPGAQEDFLASSVTELFFGGEAGGGKSWALCQDFLYDVDNPNANGILFRRTYPDLEDLIHKALDHFCGFNPKFNESKHQFIFPSGARFRFSHLQHVNAIFTHAGQEYSHIDWDEVCHFPYMPYQFLFSRLRSTDSKLTTRVRSTGNPDGEGVLWVKARFIDKLKPYEIGWFKTENDRDLRASPKQEKKLFELAKLPPIERAGQLELYPDVKGFISRMWIPTVRAENKALMDNDPNYESMLDQLPESKKRAYKFGIWDQFDVPFQVVSTKSWQDALNGANKKQHGVAAVGADYAESGDKCTLVSGRGNQPMRIREWPGMKTTEFAKLVYNEHNYYGKKQCFTGVDAVGPGVGVYHSLEETDIKDRIEACKHKDEQFDFKYEKQIIKLHFNCWRTQAWWQFKEDMESGQVDLSLLQTKEFYYDNLHFLQEEVLSHTYKIENGVVKIVSKNDLRKADSLGRSPDRADALVIWNWMRRRNPSTLKRLAKEDHDYGYYKNQIKAQERTGAESWT